MVNPFPRLIVRRLIVLFRSGRHVAWERGKVSTWSSPRIYLSNCVPGGHFVLQTVCVANISQIFYNKLVLLKCLCMGGQWSGGGGGGGVSLYFFFWGSPCSEVWKTGYKPQNAVRGFKHAGISPYDHKVIPDSALHYSEPFSRP